MKWQYKDNIIENINDVPEGAIGFIYLIFNVTKNKMYIGKKFLFSERKKNLTKKEIDALENKRLKKWKTVKTESNWLEYCGSNKQLLEDINNGDVIQKYIQKWCYSKIQLTYEEVKLLFKNEVLEKDCYYNDNINGTWYRGNIGNYDQERESSA